MILVLTGVSKCNMYSIGRNWHFVIFFASNFYLILRLVAIRYTDSYILFQKWMHFQCETSLVLDLLIRSATGLVFELKETLVRHCASSIHLFNMLKYSIFISLIIFCEVLEAVEELSPGKAIINLQFCLQIFIKLCN